MCPEACSPEVLHEQGVVIHGLGVQVVGLDLRLDVLPLLLQVHMDVLVVVALGAGPSLLGGRAGLVELLARGQGEKDQEEHHDPSLLSGHVSLRWHRPEPELWGEHVYSGGRLCMCTATSLYCRL